MGSYGHFGALNKTGTRVLDAAAARALISYVKHCYRSTDRRPEASTTGSRRQRKPSKKNSETIVPKTVPKSTSKGTKTAAPETAAPNAAAPTTTKCMAVETMADTASKTETDVAVETAGGALAVETREGKPLSRTAPSSSGSSDDESSSDGSLGVSSDHDDVGEGGTEKPGAGNGDASSAAADYDAMVGTDAVNGATEAAATAVDAATDVAVNTAAVGADAGGTENPVVENSDAGKTEGAEEDAVEVVDAVNGANEVAATAVDTGIDVAVNTAAVHAAGVTAVTDWSKLKVGELRFLLKEHDMDTTGRKAELVARLKGKSSSTGMDAATKALNKMAAKGLWIKLAKCLQHPLEGQDLKNRLLFQFEKAEIARFSDGDEGWKAYAKRRRETLKQITLFEQIKQYALKPSNAGRHTEQPAPGLEGNYSTCGSIVQGSSVVMSEVKSKGDVYMVRIKSRV